MAKNKQHNYFNGVFQDVINKNHQIGNSDTDEKVVIQNNFKI